MYNRTNFKENYIFYKLYSDTLLGISNYSQNILTLK